MKAVSTITLFVEDLSASRDFYRDALDLPLVFEDRESAAFQIGGMLVNLLVVSATAELIEPASAAPAASGARFVVTVAVDDVDTAVQELTGRGVTLLNGPINRPWGVRTASFTDPAGHIWELAQPIAGPTIAGADSCSG